MPFTRAFACRVGFWQGVGTRPPKLCRGRSQRPTLAMAKVWNVEFERIHPFPPGNGRAGRRVTNLLLIRLGYPPAIIRKAERTRYLQNLRRADEGDPAPLGEFLARAIIDTLMRFIVPAVAGPARLVPLAALATREVSVRSLRAAAERGRLRAQRDARGAVAEHAPLGRRLPPEPVQAPGLSQSQSATFVLARRANLGSRCIDVRRIGGLRPLPAHPADSTFTQYRSGARSRLGRTIRGRR